ncbi:MAG: dTDP-glucose 4,6-dehydratase, partial [Candidatus Omnitrophota bacterium]
LHKGRSGEVYNIGGGTEIPNLELTRSILEILGKDESSMEFVNDRPGHDRRYSLDISKTKALGWAPKHDFRSSLELTVNWYKNNELWWRRLVECRKNIKY